MLLVYIASRIYSINPPGDAEDSTEIYARGVHEAFREEEEKLKTEQPKISSWFCGVLLLVLIGLTVWTAECLVDSIEFVRQGSSIQEECVFLDYTLTTSNLSQMVRTHLVATYLLLRRWYCHFRLLAPKSRLP